MVLGRPRALVRAVDAEFGLAAVERLPRRLGRADFLRLRHGAGTGRLAAAGGARGGDVGDGAGEEVCVELVPRTADKVAVEPVVEFCDVFEGEELEEEALMLERYAGGGGGWRVGESRCPGRRCGHDGNGSDGGGFGDHAGRRGRGIEALVGELCDGEGGLRCVSAWTWDAH